MDAWTLQKVVAYCLAHAERRITLRQRGSTLRLTGRLAHLDERDACSMDLTEVPLHLGVPGLECVLTLHATSVLVHLSAGQGDAQWFLPCSIAYADLVLEVADAAQAEPSAPLAEPLAEPLATGTRSPYELL
jgi:hypothetical protein